MGARLSKAVRESALRGRERSVMYAIATFVRDNPTTDVPANTFFGSMGDLAFAADGVGNVRATRLAVRRLERRGVLTREFESHGGRRRFGSRIGGIHNVWLVDPDQLPLRKPNPVRNDRECDETTQSETTGYDGRNVPGSDAELGTDRPGMTGIPGTNRPGLSSTSLGSSTEGRTTKRYEREGALSLRSRGFSSREPCDMCGGPVDDLPFNPVPGSRPKCNACYHQLKDVDKTTLGNLRAVQDASSPRRQSDPDIVIDVEKEPTGC